MLAFCILRMPGLLPSYPEANGAYSTRGGRFGSDPTRPLLQGIINSKTGSALMGRAGPWMILIRSEVQLTAPDVERPNCPAIIGCRHVNRVGSKRCHIGIDGPCNGDRRLGGRDFDGLFMKGRAERPIVMSVSGAVELSRHRIVKSFLECVP